MDLRGRTALKLILGLAAVCVPITAVLLTGFFLGTASAQMQQELAEKYAPVMHFGREEKFYPTSVDYIIDSSTLKRWSSGPPILVDPNPTVYTLGMDTSTDLFLDNSLETEDAIAADYARTASLLGNYAYVHFAATQSGRVIQYWLFYPYNNGTLNDHQGDIEVIEVFLDKSENPIKAIYSQHGAGQSAEWFDIEKNDTHPVVYVAQGSHANYFRPYQGKIGLENDIVDSGGLTIAPNDLNIVILAEKGSRPSDQSWLEFAGRWGYWGTDEEVALGRAGPRGPVQNQDGIRWAQPDKYFDSTFLVDGNYFTLALVAFYFLPLFIIYVVFRGVWKAVHIIRLQRKSGLAIMNLLTGSGGIGLILGIIGILMTIVALASPWYMISASSEGGLLAGDKSIPLMSIDGLSGMQINMFLISGSDSTSGYANFFATQVSFATVFAVGLVLLILDIIGYKSGKVLGRKFLVGGAFLLLPVALIFAFILLFPLFLPWASSLVPGQQIPPQIVDTVYTVARNPTGGATSAVIPTLGDTDVTWGFQNGSFFLIIAATIRVFAGWIIWRSSTPDSSIDGPESGATDGDVKIERLSPLQHSSQTGLSQLLDQRDQNVLQKDPSKNKQVFLEYIGQGTTEYLGRNEES
jgi:hypothetical protein